MNIDWKKYVDHIYCITCDENANRYNDLINTLNYANINVNNEKLINIISDKFDNYSTKDLIIKHYKACEECINNNYKRILVLEDDIRILNNENKIIEYLNNIPENFDICLLDYQIPKEYENTISNIINSNLYYFKYDNLYSTAAYIISYDGCQKFINKYNVNYRAEIDLLYNNLLDSKISIRENIFIQYEYSNKLHNKFNTKINYINRNKLNFKNYYMYND